MKRILVILILVIPLEFLSAQDGFGFGDADGFGFQDAASFSVKIGGEVSAELISFLDDFTSKEKMGNIRLGDIFSGSLNFEAGSSAAQGVISLNLTPVFDGSSPVAVDEAYVRTFFGPVTVEGGLRKITWGKADSFGPMDVINPLDYSDLTKLSDPLSIKIARPMVRTSFSLGSYTKLEAVFVPWFQGHKFDTRGRWAPGQITNLAPELVEGLKKVMVGINPSYEGYFPGLDLWLSNYDVEGLYQDHNTALKYAQAGTRFTTTIGSSDLGFQYYFGRFPRPSVNINIDDFVLGLMSGSPPNPNAVHININYNYYHQIAADFARVVAGFNLRAEAGVNLTKDLDGTDGAVENPAFVWSLGFDRDLVWGIKLNLQGSGKLRLFYSKIGDNLLEDCEADANLSSTRITGIISRKFLRDELELKLTGLWGIEDKDFLIMPAICWERNDVSAEVRAGFFGGDKKGELGQYKDNSFLKLILSYKF